MIKNTLTFALSAVVVLALAFAMVVPMSANAAVNVDNIIFSSNMPFSAGSTVNADIYLTSDGNNDIESISYRYTNATGIDAQWRCYDVNPNQTQASPLGGWIVDANLLVPANGGLFTLEIGSHGTDGDPEDNQCLTSADDTTTFSNRVEVSGSTSSTSGTSGGNTSVGSSSFQSQLDALNASIKALSDAVAKIVTGNVGGSTPGAACAQLMGYNSLSYGDRGTFVTQAQLYVMSHGGNIPAGATGFWGNQSASALSQAKMVNSCK